MKILLSHEIFAPDIVGGGDIIVLETARRLVKEGFKVKVITTGNPKIKSFEGIETIRLPIHRYLMNLSAPFMIPQARKADIIHTFTFNACFPSWLCAKLTSKPVVLTVLGVYRNAWQDIRGPVLGRLYKKLEKIQVNRSYDKILFISNFNREEGLKLGIPKEKTDVTIPGIEYKNFKSSKKEKHVLFVGRLSKQKGLDYLLQAAVQLPDIDFLIVGEGEERKRLEKIASKNVKFLGLIPHDDKRLYDLYSKALIFCAPSIGEGFGLVIPEAMASGCAIVSTVPLDYRDFIVKPRDVESLKNKIRYLYDNPRLAEKFGKENRKLAKKYTWDAYIKKLIEIYSETIL